MGVPPPLPDSLDLSGYSVLITGANIGLGHACALQMLQHKASPVHLAVRNLSKGNAARDRLLSDPVVKKNNPSAVVTVYEVDMASYPSVLAFSTKFQEENKTLNMAVLNAGVSYINYVASASGYEMCLQVNHLSTALLSLLLLPILTSTAKVTSHPASLSIVSSSTYSMTSYKKCPPPETNIIDDLNDPKQYKSLERYPVSKLLITLWVRELARHVDPSSVIVNQLCPGMVKTNLDNNGPWWMRRILGALRFVAANSAEVAASTLTHAAAMAGPETHGEFLKLCAVTQYSDFVRGPEGEKMQKKVWDETMEKLKDVSPKVDSIL